MPIERSDRLAIAHMLKAFRARNQLNQKEFVEKCDGNLTLQRITRLENRNARATVQDLRGMVKAGMTQEICELLEIRMPRY